MKENLLHYKNLFVERWNTYQQNQKIMIIAALIFLVLALGLIVFWAQRTEFVPVYTHLSPEEAGEIVTTIESMGVPVRISDGGRTLSVPKAESSRIRLELAFEGIPRHGNINYGIFTENMGFGMTDKQFDVIDRVAMQTELRYLIEQIDDINHAQVVITMPSENIWLSDDNRTASASVLLNLRPGTQLSQERINGLYHLISKTVPQLPVEEIALMDQNWNQLAKVDQSDAGHTLSIYEQQRQVRRHIEQDIQQDIHQLLGTILGRRNVVVAVFANIDFSKENREEHLVDSPFDEDEKQGIAISVERIQESFEGAGGSAGGVSGTGEQDIPNYPAFQGSGDSEYESLEERINYEVNRVYRQIERSPYHITDLSISVGIEPPRDADDEPLAELPAAIEDNVRSILSSVVSTSLSSTGVNFSDEAIEQRITIFASPFQGRVEFDESSIQTSNTLVYALAVALLLAVATLAFVILRKRQSALEEDLVELTDGEEQEVFSFETDANTTQKRMEQLAKENPQEFAQLLKTWLYED